VGRPKAGEPELRREIIAETALEILDAEGLEALSLSRIARALNVQTSALYWYFKSKADLYEHLCELVFRRVLGEIDPSLTGRDLLRAFGRSFRSNLRSIRDAAKLTSVGGVSESLRTELIPDLLGRVAAGDVSPLEARRALTAIEALALGWVIFEGSGNATVGEVMRRTNDPHDSAFEHALEALAYHQFGTRR
jgi:TetR/AcrR family tetracycline transcriptional repressor